MSRRARRHRVRYNVHGTEEAPVATTLRIRTRLRPSPSDTAVLATLGEHFSHLQGMDLALRCKYGADHDKDAWAARKRAITAHCSSRYAGFVTKGSNDAYATARRNQYRALWDKKKATEVIEEKLALPVHSQAERQELLEQEGERAGQEGRRPRDLDFGYRSAHEHAMKRQRLQKLRSEVSALEADLAAGTVHITRGGKGLLRKRLHLGEANLSKEQWLAAWQAKRWSFGANGEAGKAYGNETIRVYPDGTLEVDLPSTLSGFANITTRGLTRYRFDARAGFSYRQEEWLAQVEGNRAVAYEICFSPGGKVYLDASFTPAISPDVPKLAELLADEGLRVLAVDLNHGFLAPAVLDSTGNPIRLLPHVPLLTEDLPASARDGHLRQAVTELVNLAEAHGCELIVGEDLGFSDMRATGRERYGSRKWFRKVVCGMPTRQFRDRLVAMASRRGIAVAGVPAAYSSIWGAQHWQAPLSTKSQKVSRHTAAAVVLGRRSLGYPARRRPQASPGVTAPGQRTEEAGAPESAVSPAGVESYHVGVTGLPGERHKQTSKPHRREGHPSRRHLARGAGRKTRSGDVGLQLLSATLDEDRSAILSENRSA